MEKIVVQNSIRKKRRDLNDALGDDILRYLAELITNADDSYKRIEKNNKTDGVIYIELTKDGYYKLSVTDNAEGMDLETLKNIFGTYGNDNSKGLVYHTRGIFGQGASDVLRSSAYDNKDAIIYSIKDNKLSKLVYTMDDNLNAEILVNQEKLTDDIRKKLSIPNNGTKIIFGIPDKVKFTSKIKDSLSSLICKYPSFRYLMDKNYSNRKIYYIENIMGTKLKYELSSMNYEFKKELLMLDKTFTLNFEDNKIKCRLKLYNNPNKKDDNTNILVIDENLNVFDNTNFDYSSYVGMSNISGELLIPGLYNICYEHLNRLIPDAILRDNRTGFDTKNKFYIELNKKVSGILEKFLMDLNNSSKSTNLTNKAGFNKVLKKLNEMLNSEISDDIEADNLKEIEPPKEGIKFSRDNITITKGKKYNLKLYINPKLIKTTDKITIASNSDNLNIIDNIISYSEDDIKDNLVIKSIPIIGNKITKDINLNANTSKYNAKCIVNITDLDVHYPKNGLEFYPSNISSPVNQKHTLKLYLDSNIIPLGSSILIKSKLGNNIINFNLDNLITENIGVINVSFNGGTHDNSYEVKAVYDNVEAYANINIILEKDKDIFGDGLIAGFKLEKSSMPMQSYYDKLTHYIIINTDNEINKMLVENISKISKTDKLNKDALKLICDLISREASSLLICKRNNINLDNIDTAYLEFSNSYAICKNNIFKKLYKILITK